METEIYRNGPVNMQARIFIIIQVYITMIIRSYKGNKKGAPFYILGALYINFVCVSRCILPDTR